MSTTSNNNYNGTANNPPPTPIQKNVDKNKIRINTELTTIKICLMRFCCLFFCIGIFSLFFLDKQYFISILKMLIGGIIGWFLNELKSKY